MRGRTDYLKCNCGSKATQTIYLNAVIDQHCCGETSKIFWVATVCRRCAESFYSKMKSIEHYQVDEVYEKGYENKSREHSCGTL